jgi:hypothetical protein
VKLFRSKRPCDYQKADSIRVDRTHQRRESMDNDEILKDLLPYRMKAVDILNRALHLQAKHGAPRIKVCSDNELLFEGNLNAFTNGAIEAGLMHCRALLEFLGLRAHEGRLGTVGKRRNDDKGIEHFSTASISLSQLTLDQTLSWHDGGRDEAEKVLLAVFRITNKGIAHFTADFASHPEDGNLIEIASRAVPHLVISHLYKPLGLPVPDFKISGRPRGG